MLQFSVEIVVNNVDQLLMELLMELQIKTLQQVLGGFKILKHLKNILSLLMVVFFQTKEKEAGQRRIVIVRNIKYKIIVLTFLI